MNLLSHTCRVPYRARGALPLEPHEIDALPDGDRVWATVLKIRREYSARGDADYPSGREVGHD